jgi:hypothetical protein
MPSVAGGEVVRDILSNGEGDVEYDEDVGDDVKHNDEGVDDDDEQQIQNRRIH